ncbi:phosphocholine-specific phospholipase C [Cupriavidus sp. IDO]|uniref:phosphocholine-specific phospholipase C n=1 Tax=Cupriavidus sp. IDO TaxID=1539142 RepID=UPI0005796CA3|nr:phospholipase C, phosphocholine-specific [Cupriavidus sp. IDO]KWR88980.1 phospholipase C, phosphocholine-specific [Cupriavidus sp. IDO]
MTKIDRRTFLTGAVKSAAAASVLSMLPPSIARALAVPAAVNTGTIQDVQHVVILMQENRALDHYFGAMRGVRGFGDRFPVPVPSGKPVWFESNGTREITPFHLDSATVNALRVSGTPHSFMDAQNAWSQGRFGFWAKYKNDQSMGYYRREDIPFQYALAEAFTLCDAYHCSHAGGTDPNRITFMSGSNYNPAVREAGRNCTADDAEVNNLRCSVGGQLPTPGYTYHGSAFQWSTLPELLQAKGVSWRIYQNPNANWGGLLHGGLAFKSFRESQPGNPLYDNGMSSWTIEQLAAHVRDGTLPAVSWILPTPAQSEHPGGPSSAAEGAAFINTVLTALTANPEVWSKTVFFITFDENDGFFDHMPPAAVPSYDANGVLHGKSTVDVTGEYFDTAGNTALDGTTTSGETIRLRPYGFGPRVPMYVISPWTRGGWINSQVFDHTSMGRFLEQRFGITVPAISPWHRAVAGDLTSVFDFRTPNDQVFPTLPDTSNYQQVIAEQLAKPKATAPAVPASLFQETGTKYSRALPYVLHASALAEPTIGKLKLIFSNTGEQGAVFHVYDRLHLDQIPRRYTVEPGKMLDDEWDARTTDNGRYDLAVYGPNGFARMFKGQLPADVMADAPEVRVCYDLDQGSVYLSARNDGKGAVNGGGKPLTLVVTPNAYRNDGPWQLHITAGAEVEHHWPLQESGNWYDFTVTEAESGFERRFAGRLETGQHGVTDPAMATGLG